MKGPDNFRDDFSKAIAAMRGAVERPEEVTPRPMMGGRRDLQEGMYTDDEEQSDRFKFQREEAGALEWVTGWGFPVELGRALVYHFDLNAIPVPDAYALCIDLQDMMTSEGFSTYDDAAVELLRRIGGDGNILSYVKTISHPPVPNVESRKPRSKRLKEATEHTSRKQALSMAHSESAASGEYFAVYQSTSTGLWVSMKFPSDSTGAFSREQVTQDWDWGTAKLVRSGQEMSFNGPDHEIGGGYHSTLRWESKNKIPESRKPRSKRLNESRSVREIAAEIAQLWPNVNYAARPYLDAMFSLDSVNDNYYYDSGRSVVLYFLSNATSWRGPDAKRIKAELKSMM